MAVEPIGGYSAWPVQRQTYGYLPSHKASPFFGQYQIKLLGKQLAQGCYLAVHRAGVEPATSWLQVRHSTVTPPSHMGN